MSLDKESATVGELTSSLSLPQTFPQAYPHKRANHPVIAAIAHAAISLVDAAGNPVNAANAGVRQFNDGRQVWTLNRNDFAGDWDGNWTLQLSQNNVGAVAYQVLVDLSQISWQPIPDLGSEPRLMSVGETYQFRLIIN